MNVPAKRIHSLDYLRGLAAVGIMFYHMHLLSFGEIDSESPFARIKIYAVTIFFVLSGLTLYKVYINNLAQTGIKNFFIKRFFRIFPLLWLVTILTFLLSMQSVTMKKLALNLLVLPGIIKPEMFIANGAWSIGNELGFYLLFPLIIVFTKKSVNNLILAIFLSAIPFLYYTYFVLDPAIPLGLQWKHYVSPLSQFLFFTIGMGLGAMKAPHPTLVKLAPYLAAVSVALLFFYPVSGEPIHLTSGNNRIFFSLVTTLLCYFIYIADFHFLPAPVQWCLSTLGEISYSVYLLHPIIFMTIIAVLGESYQSHIYEIIGSTVLITIVLSYFTYQYFEKYFMNLSKKFHITNKSSLVLK